MGDLWIAQRLGDGAIGGRGNAVLVQRRQALFRGHRARPLLHAIHQASPIIPAVGIYAKARVADPAGGFVENLASRIFKAIEVGLGDEADDGEVFAVGSPVGVLDGIEDRARSAATDGKSRQSAGTHVAGADVVEVLNDQEFAGARDGGERVGGYAERPHALAIKARGVEGHRGVGTPARGGDDALAVGEETGGVDRALLEGELDELGRTRMSASAGQEPSADKQQGEE